MNRSQNKAETDKNLLSDDDFVALMDAEYQSMQTSENELEKQQIWQSIDQRIQKTKRVSRRTWLSLASAAMIVLAVLPLLLLNTSPQVSIRLKGEQTPLPALHLSVYSFNSNGELKPLSHTANVGDTLVFKIGATEQVVVGLTTAVNQREPLVRFVSDKLAAGMEQLLERDGRAYGYIVEVDDRELEFCAIAAYGTDQLEVAIKSFIDKQNLLAREACVTLFVNQ